MGTPPTMMEKQSGNARTRPSQIANSHQKRKQENNNEQAPQHKCKTNKTKKGIKADGTKEEEKGKDDK
jgi:hypothetical protein